MSEKPSRFKKLLFINLPLAFSIPITLSVVYYVLSSPNQFLVQLNLESPQGEWNFESKVSTLLRIMSWYSLYLLALIQVTTFSRLLSQKSPLRLKKENESADIIDVMNRVISNSIEQLLIFMPLLAYWTLTYSNEENKVQVIAFGALYLIARILFFLGYIFGWMIQIPTLRALGFSCNLTINFIFAIRALNNSLI
jgi:hypothetical protein